MRLLNTIALLILLASGCGHRDPQVTPPPSSGRPGSSMEQGWVSSGGQVLKDSLNPWWVKNTTSVNYCVLIDRSTISAKPEDILTAITQSIDFWKREFNAKLEYVTNSKDTLITGHNDAGIATQAFLRSTTVKEEGPLIQYGDCNSDTHLVFQYGEGTLTPVQKEYYGDNLKTYIEDTVRTFYDPALLKGQGFMYFASDVGPNKYNSVEKLLERPWAYRKLVSMAHVHGLGHVFGLPDESSHWSIMGRTYLETLLRWYALPEFQAFLQTNTDDSWMKDFRYFFPSTMFAAYIDKERKESHDFFRVKEESFTLQFKLDTTTGKSPELIVSAQEVTLKKESDTSTSIHYNGPAKKIGRIKKLKLSQTHVFPVVVVADNRQKVFDTSPGDYPRHILGPSLVALSGTGVYVSEDKSEAPVQLSIRGDKLRLYGLIGKENADLLNSPDYREISF